MYNLLIVYPRDAWEGEPYNLERDRLFEHTSEELARRFATLDEASLNELMSYPAIFANESVHGRPAHLGRITRIQFRQNLVRITYLLSVDLPPLSPEVLRELVWDLDINDSEFNRTHWALKDVDLPEVLIQAGLLDRGTIAGLEPDERRVFGGTAPAVEPDLEPIDAIEVNPTVFRVPVAPAEADLVSVMMPFREEFAPVYSALGRSCTQVRLRCQNANEIWDENEVIQDIFSLIYRSRFVICDFSGRNPNVFYEAGIAHTLGRVVIPIVQSEADVPFDLQHHRYLHYRPDEQGLGELEAAVTSRLRTLLLRG